MFSNKMAEQEFSKYERVRIIGARGLQISMDAPLLTKMSEEELEGVNYNPLRIAERELDSGVLPISVNKPMPKRKEKDIRKIKIEESKVSDEEKEKTEKEEEKDIAKSGEIMELSGSGEDPEAEEESSTESVSEDLE